MLRWCSGCAALCSSGECTLTLQARCLCRTRLLSQGPCSPAVLLQYVRDEQAAELTELRVQSLNMQSWLMEQQLELDLPAAQHSQALEELMQYQQLKDEQLQQKHQLMLGKLQQLLHWWQENMQAASMPAWQGQAAWLQFTAQTPHGVQYPPAVASCMLVHNLCCLPVNLLSCFT